MRAGLDIDLKNAVARYKGVNPFTTDISFFGMHNFGVSTTLSPTIPTGRPDYDLVAFGYGEDDCAP